MYTSLDSRHQQDFPLSTATNRLHEDDNVVVALRACGTIPAGHKIAAETISPGTPIIKYGHVIGIASKTISAGEHVHTHNVDVSEIACEYAAHRDDGSTEPPAESRTFQGFRRDDGRAATRNYIGIVTTVNCSASVAHHIATSLAPELDDEADQEDKEEQRDRERTARESKRSQDDQVEE